MALIRGTIYKLSDDKGYFYFGSTIQTLRERLYVHKHDSKRHSKYNIYTQFTFEKFCQNKIKIEVLDEVVVENKRELQQLEQQYITKYRNDLKLLNTLRSYATEEEKKYKENRLKYRNDNREDINQRATKYREKNSKIIVCECGKQSAKYHLSDHIKSQFHKDFIANNN